MPKRGHIRSNQMILVGQFGHQVPEHVACRRESVQQKDGGILRIPGFAVEDFAVIDRQILIFLFQLSIYQSPSYEKYAEMKTWFPISSVSTGTGGCQIVPDAHFSIGSPDSACDRPGSPAGIPCFRMRTGHRHSTICNNPH